MLAELDCLLSLAACAREYSLVKPTLTEQSVLEVKGGRHPLLHLVVSQLVPNDCALGGADGKRLCLLTGPNASGKTVYLRTVALVAYLAHVGSFVPAEAQRPPGSPDP